MPRVIVTADESVQDEVPVLLDEHVQSVHLSSDHPAMQFIERLGWAISDAWEPEPVPYRSARPRAHGRRRQQHPRRGAFRPARI